MARDFYHQAVRTALEKEGWVITNDPYSFKVGGVDFQIDLGAERVIAAEKAGEKIAVEIKSFVGQSPVSVFHEATGQYDNYLMALEEKEADRILFLAIPKITFEEFFQRPFVKKVVRRKNIRIIVYEPENQIIEQWIK